MELEAVRYLATCALQNLEAHRTRIDDLNVYPVPDGDTGTNLTLTLRSIVEALESSSADSSNAVAKDVTRAALMGARGNSGVIFSQIVRGFVEVLGETNDVSTPRLRRAFRSASDAAYRAVKRPVEGTMLTVIREMAEEGERKENRRLPAPDFLKAVLARGEVALARTPELLDILRNAGVVDAGGAGFVEIARGLVHGASGEPLPDAPVQGETLSIDAIHLEPSEYRYCTVFFVEGENLDQEALESTLEQLGDSLLVVGDRTALKVHVHTDDPGSALSAATMLGVVEGVEIANMHHQTAQREDRLLETAGVTMQTLETGLVAVCPGRGNRRLFESLGATRVIEGGQSMNPSAAELVAAIDSVPAAEVIVLPNNSNVVLTAEQAAMHAKKSVRVVPSRSVQAGFAAIGRYVSTNTPEENEQAMRDGARLGGDRRGHRCLTRREARRQSRSTRETSSGSSTTPPSPRTRTSTTVLDEVVERVLDGEREWLAILTGEGCAAPRRARRAVSNDDHPDVDDRACTTAGSPTTRLLLVAE